MARTVPKTLENCDGVFNWPQNHVFIIFLLISVENIFSDFPDFFRFFWIFYTFCVYFWVYFIQKYRSGRPSPDVLWAFMYLGTLCGNILGQTLTYTLFCSHMEILYQRKHSVLILMLPFEALNILFLFLIVTGFQKSLAYNFIKKSQNRPRSFLPTQKLSRDGIFRG